MWTNEVGTNSGGKYSDYDSMRLKTETSNDVNIRYLVTH